MQDHEYVPTPLRCRSVCRLRMVCFEKVLLDECTDWSRIHGKKPKAGSDGKVAKKKEGNSENVLDHISKW